MIFFKVKSKDKIDFIFVKIIFGLIVISLLCLNIFFINQNKKNILNSIQEKNRLLCNDINKEIKSKFDDLNIASKYIRTEDFKNPQNTLEGLRKLLEKNHFDKISITLPDGISYITTGDIINISNREYFKESMNGKNYLSNIVYSNIPTSLLNIYSVPIFINGKVIGVLCASMDMEIFFKSLSLEKYDNWYESYIIDKSGNFIFQSGNKIMGKNFFDFTFKNNKKNIKNLKKMKEDFAYNNHHYQLFKYKNGNSYICYSKLNYNNWWLINNIPVEKVKYNNSSMFIISTSITIGLFLMLSSTFIILFYENKKKNALFKDMIFTDDITGGKNYLYLKSNINNIINKKGKFAFISLEILKIKHLVNLFSNKNIELLSKEIYNHISKKLFEGELIVHSNYGEYKLILKYNDIPELIERIENIDLNKIYKNIDYKIGIYLIDKTDIELEQISSYANIAKENIDDDFKYAIYKEEMHKKELDRIKLEEDIKQGIANNEFKAWFQPKYSKDGKTIIGAEALVRWYKYDSVISPYIFIPICEEVGLIQCIDKLVLEDVCKNLRLWIDKNKNVVPISVNLSRAYLDKSNCIEQAEELINKYNIPRELIQFEITESSIVCNEKSLKETINTLHEKGFKILLDDFGVGYSSIKSISDMNFDTLKIDKSFVDGIGEKRWDHIIDYTIHLSKKLNMDVTAEGIETEEQYKFLLSCDCTSFQGYYFNKPMDSISFSKLL